MAKVRAKRTKGFSAVQNKTVGEVVSKPVFCALSGETVSSRSWGVPETDRAAREAKAAAKKYARRKARTLENAATRRIAQNGDSDD